MSDRTYKAAEIRNGRVVIFPNYISKKDAIQRIKQGQDVMAKTRSQAETLSTALSSGQSVWRDQAHLLGGYKHFHDGQHTYRGHIFYGQPA